MRPLGSRLVPFLALVLLAAPADAQIPDQFTNLDVLPKDIAQGELIGTMRGFAGGLQVRCEHCHVGEPGQPLSSFDFAADDKEPKRVARVMMRMTREINARLAADLGRDPAGLVEVRCITCHRGATRPRQIADVLAEESATGGVEAALAAYRRLREESYGSGVFDFSERPLRSWASKLAQAGETADALAVLALGEELFPESIYLKGRIAEVHYMAGDREQALAGFRKVLELDPENRFAAMRLREIEGPETIEGPEKED